MRTVLFCNEMLGLGHVGVSLSVAEELVKDPDDTAVIVTGSPAAGTFRLPPGVDVVKIPTAPVDADSAWASTGRNAAAGLHLEQERITGLRADIYLAAVERVDPDVVLVDYRPVGRYRDVVPALEAVKRRGRAINAFGVWDSDDSPAALRTTWTDDLIGDVGRLYDLAFVYGPPEPDDIRVAALHSAGLAVHEVGFVSRPPATTCPSDLEPGYLLVMAGGGVDGAPMFEAVVDAVSDREIDVPLVLLTGPLMSAAEISSLRESASAIDALVFESRSDVRELLFGARAVVSMAGYCSTTEILASGKPALFVPRVIPREEQFNRARRLAADGRAAMLHPDDLSASTMGEAIVELLAAEPRPAARLSGAADVRSVLAAATAAST